MPEDIISQADEEQLPKQVKEKKRIVNIDKKDAYLAYKESDGLEYNDQILSNINELKSKKIEIKELTETCNKIKSSIENLKMQLDKK